MLTLWSVFLFSLLKAPIKYLFSSSSVHSSDVYGKYPVKCCSISFFLTHFLSFYLSRFSFYNKISQNRVTWYLYLCLWLVVAAACPAPADTGESGLRPAQNTLSSAHPTLPACIWKMMKEEPSPDTSLLPQR